jgi:hypothetical protein
MKGRKGEGWIEGRMSIVAENEEKKIEYSDTQPYTLKGRVL